jgi:hypothetical protein
VSLVRLGGLAAMVCGVLYAAQGLVVWLSEPPFSLSFPYLDNASDLTWQTLVNVSDVVFLVGALVAAAALAILCILHGGYYGLAGTLVSLVVLASLALLVVLGLGDVFQWFTSWRTSTPLIWGSLLATLGGMGLGALTIAVRVLPWWGCANNRGPKPGTCGARWRAFRDACGSGLGAGRTCHLPCGGASSEATPKSAMRGRRA